MEVGSLTFWLPNRISQKIQDAASLIDSLSVVRCGDNEKQTRVEGTKQHKVSKKTNTVTQNISQEKTIEQYKTSKK